MGKNSQPRAHVCPPQQLPHCRDDSLTQTAGPRSPSGHHHFLDPFQLLRPSQAPASHCPDTCPAPKDPRALPSTTSRCRLRLPVSPSSQHTAGEEAD